MRQLTLPIARIEPPSFETFVVAGNEAAVAHLRAIAAADPASPAVPVYLWGAPGSGKTHLLTAVAATVGIENSSWTIADDCHRLDAAQQHALFTRFVEAATSGSAIVAAGASPPVDLPVREDLRTRLGWGHVFELHPLDDEHTAIALRGEAQRRGIALGDEVMHYLLTRFPRNLAGQIALLNRLDGYSLSLHRGVTVPLLKQMLAESA
jgi:DnaA-homolog protein